jgi:predicted RNA polymerase sigma factor
VNETDAAAAGDGEAPRSPAAASDLLLSRIIREEYGRIVAALTARIGDLDIAEDAVAAAVEDALRTWRVHGLPPNPAAWLTLAARHDALDRLRRETSYRSKLALLAEPAMSAPPEEAGEADERIAMLFGCCHPALSAEAQLALTLRVICGLSTAQIARATLSTDSAVAQRIVRAKRKIGAAGIPIRIPDAVERAPRLELVLTVVSVMYAEAHLPIGGDAAADRDLADDAIWLARVLADALPREAEVHGLLALLLLHRARESARAVDGELVLLADQDRGRWDAALVAEGRAELDRAAVLRRPGRWQLHAAIAACHADAPTSEDTDWLQVLTLYDLLLPYDPSPIVRLNRAVALAAVEGPSLALAETDTLTGTLSGYYLWHAIRGHFLRELGRDDEALEADLRAIELTANDAERRLIAARRVT